ncbi:MAG: hypothetical protein JXJ17_05610 [Anaerolineae bacterium]|nr:hypothetical protein [Anaerolineae bacterium]
MGNWRSCFRYDPVGPLLESGNPALVYFTRRDLLDEDPGPVDDLWALSYVEKILRKQRDDGSWKYPGGKDEVRTEENYDQIETYRQVGVLVEKYGMTRDHPPLQKAAEFLFEFQTGEGDFRGIYGTQYTPNYSGGIMELLIKAGYGDDPRIEKGFDWLLAIRQAGGGWAIPALTAGEKLSRENMFSDLIQPDRGKPNSHLVTGCVLRAFAAHPRYRDHEAAQQAGRYLMTRLFKRGEYPGRQGEDFWYRFTFPFWFTDLLSAFDSLTRLGFDAGNRPIQEVIDWFVDRQLTTGAWKLNLLKGAGDPKPGLWISLAICRAVRRAFDL